jgi:hypothetical protein
VLLKKADCGRILSQRHDSARAKFGGGPMRSDAIKWGEKGLDRGAARLIADDAH